MHYCCLQRRALLMLMPFNFSQVVFKSYPNSQYVIDGNLRYFFPAFKHSQMPSDCLVSINVFTLHNTDLKVDFHYLSLHIFPFSRSSFFISSSLKLTAFSGYLQQTFCYNQQISYVDFHKHSFSFRGKKYFLAMIVSKKILIKRT